MATTAGDDAGVQIVGELTLEERLERDKREAEARGDLVVIEDDDGNVKVEPPSKRARVEPATLDSLLQTLSTAASFVVPSVVAEIKTRIHADEPDVHKTILDAVLTSCAKPSQLLSNIRAFVHLAYSVMIIGAPEVSDGQARAALSLLPMHKYDTTLGEGVFLFFSAVFRRNTFVICDEVVRAVLDGIRKNKELHKRGMQTLAAACPGMNVDLAVKRGLLVLVVKHLDERIVFSPQIERLHAARCCAILMRVFAHNDAYVFVAQGDGAVLRKLKRVEKWLTTDKFSRTRRAGVSRGHR